MKIIQIGANKGNTNNDPVWALCQEFAPDSYNWELILVEPNPHAMVILKESYKEFKNARFIEAAVSNKRGSTFLYVDNIDRAGHEGSQHASLNKNHLFKMGHQKSDIGQIQVNKIVFDDLIDDNQPIDLLQLDTEGHDFDILLSINFEKHTIKQIYYEFAHMTKKEQDTIKNKLQNAGYIRTHKSQEDEIWSKQ